MAIERALGPDVTLALWARTANYLIGLLLECSQAFEEGSTFTYSARHFVENPKRDSIILNRNSNNLFLLSD